METLGHYVPLLMLFLTVATTGSAVVRWWTHRTELRAAAEARADAHLDGDPSIKSRLDRLVEQVKALEVSYRQAVARASDAADRAQALTGEMELRMKETERDHARFDRELVECRRRIDQLYGAIGDRERG